MKILVISDSHQRSFYIKDVLKRERDFALLIHLGDGALGMQSVLPLPGCQPVLQVRGNCDAGVELPNSLLTQEGGKTIFCTHGHLQSVKYGTEKLIKEAGEAGADIALYGHTHQSAYKYENGMYICNPGALKDGNYAVLEILPQGVLWLPKRL